MEDDDIAGLDLDLAASSLRADNGDVRILVKLLVSQLQPALGDRLRVEYKRARFKKTDEIRSVRIDMGDDTFEATVQDGSITCQIGHVSGGIRIRTERVDIDQWVVQLLRSLQAEAKRSQSARNALEAIILGGTP